MACFELVTSSSNHQHHQNFSTSDNSLSAASKRNLARKSSSVRRFSTPTQVPRHMFQNPSWILEHVSRIQLGAAPATETSCCRYFPSYVTRLGTFRKRTASRENQQPQRAAQQSRYLSQAEKEKRLTSRQKCHRKDTHFTRLGVNEIGDPRTRTKVKPDENKRTEVVVGWRWPRKT